MKRRMVKKIKKSSPVLFDDCDDYKHIGAHLIGFPHMKRIMVKVINGYLFASLTHDYIGSNTYKSVVKLLEQTEYTYDIYAFDTEKDMLDWLAG